MTGYEKEFYKNWHNYKYLRKHGGDTIITIVNKIEKTSANGPFIDSDIAELIYERIKTYNPSKELIQEHVKTAIWYIRKGNSENIFEILIDKLKLN